MPKLRSLRVLGVHTVEPTDALFEQTLETQWGSDLSETELERAQEAVREHFAGVYLIEVELDPPDAEIDWAEVTQSGKGQAREQWQVPWDEQPVDEASGRWAFFLHFVNLDETLATPVGPVPLAVPTPRPPHLAAFEYEAPG